MALTPVKEKGHGYGYGKVILFGEHFVVHGIPAIVCALHYKTTAVVEKGDRPGVELIDNRPAAEGYKEAKKEHSWEAINLILKKMGIPADTPLRITLNGDLFAASGVGASAAFCTAIARALNDYYGMGLDDDGINEIAHEGEKGFHGNPSGVDDTASTYGGFLWFKKGDPRPHVEKIDVPGPLYIVMGNSGTVANTKKAVALVREGKENNPEKFNPIFKRAEELVSEAREALEKYDLERVGELMNENHSLLRDMGLSTDVLEKMVSTAIQNGALGAKITGGGLGGYMVALVRDEEEQKRVENALLDLQKETGAKITTLSSVLGRD